MLYWLFFNIGGSMEYQGHQHSRSWERDPAIEQQLKSDRKQRCDDDIFTLVIIADDFMQTETHHTDWSRSFCTLRFVFNER
jgi:hypothetical protein